MKFRPSTLIVFLAFAVISPMQATAAEGKARRAVKTIHRPAPTVENTGGELKENEYEVISTNDSIRRALCPYTCKMRGIPKSHCREWRSQINRQKCYVQDTSLPSEAVKLR